MPASKDSRPRAKVKNKRKKKTKKKNQRKKRKLFFCEKNEALPTSYISPPNADPTIIFPQRLCPNSEA